MNETEITNALKEGRKLNTDQDKLTFISNCIKDKNTEEIVDIINKLNSEPPADTGGLNAMTGFYFQLLVTLYYLVDLLEGKWNFVAIELHQDLIVGNSTDIRFVQVKSKVLQDRESSVEVTKTDLYSDWLQKLFYMAKFFPKDNSINTQFELVTNFYIKNSPKVKMEHYLYNESFNRTINEDDHLLEKIVENKTLINNIEIDFLDTYGASERDLLSRFSINPITINPRKLEDFIDLISSKLGKVIGRAVGVSRETIDYLIGELSSRCNHSNDSSVLFITCDDAELYRKILAERAANDLDPFYRDFNSNQLIEESLARITEDFNRLSDTLKQKVCDELDTFGIELKEWVSNGISVIEIINRYMEGREYSSNVRKMSAHHKKEILIDILKTLFMLKIIYEKEMLISTNYRTLFVKEVENAHISTLGLELEQSKEEGIDKLMGIILSATEEEKIQMLFQSHYTIFQGDYFEDDFEDIEKLDFNEYFKPVVAGLNKEATHNEVNSNWSIVPGKQITKDYRKLIRINEEYEEYKNQVKLKWKTILS
ncbi:dsDNA nuclease domain-containing protein [Pseudalkalibacillus decolorationis]|uniref:dsDNA nuclease domain-containing protein n=1 Tax=Pseudalkalibacillus decolorationis TaxID=163879 RepID=UPI002148C9D1|nr:dsDNA nuclease domain-containing protein [Pseudalkalibacillus decolorationis]